MTFFFLSLLYCTVTSCNFTVHESILYPWHFFLLCFLRRKSAFISITALARHYSAASLRQRSAAASTAQLERLPVSASEHSQSGTLDRSSCLLIAHSTRHGTHVGGGGDDAIIICPSFPMPVHMMPVWPNIENSCFFCMTPISNQLKGAAVTVVTCIQYSTIYSIFYCTTSDSNPIV